MKPQEHILHGHDLTRVPLTWCTVIPEWPRQKQSSCTPLMPNNLFAVFNRQTDVQTILWKIPKVRLSKTYTHMSEMEQWWGRSEARHRNGLQIIMIGRFVRRYPWIKGSNGYCMAVPEQIPSTPPPQVMGSFLSLVTWFDKLVRLSCVTKPLKVL